MKDRAGNSVSIGLTLGILGSVASIVAIEVLRDHIRKREIASRARTHIARADLNPNNFNLPDTHSRIRIGNVRVKEIKGNQLGIGSPGCECSREAIETTERRF